MDLKDALAHEDLAIGSYRFAVGHAIPQMTQVALEAHKKDLLRETPNFNRKQFLYRLSRSDYERDWGKTYTKPGLGIRILSTLLRYVPRVGPFKGLGFDSPTPQTEDLYIKSIDTTTDNYRAYLEEVRANSLVLPNFDLDSGQLAAAGEYSLTDEAYATLLAELSANHFEQTAPQLRENILQFYSDLSIPVETKKNAVRWQGVLTDLDQLRSAAPAPVAGVAVGTPLR